VARVEPTAAANRIVYRRGAFEEWYVNGPLGLEQGFTVADPPHEGAAACRPAPAGSGGCGARAPLVFELAMTGGLRGEVEDGGRALALHGPDGAAVLRFAGVGAWDRDGRELRAWLERREGVVQLRVDDAGARYPIIVDPFLQSAKLTASDGAAHDELGWSVAASGDTVVLGAPGDPSGPGAAYVFAKPVTGWATMTESFKLTASDGAADDRFGWSVAVSGDTIVVGAPRDDLGIQTDAGSAYVFVMSMGTPVQVAKLTASDSLTDKRFGESVAIDGDTVVAGARGDTSGRGAAYVFVKPAGGWVSGTQTAKLTASDGVANDGLGFAVAVSGDTVVAGAPFDDIGTATQRGSAYVFVKPVMGWATGTQTAKLTASGGVGGDLFGASVAIAGDTAVVGAPSVGDGRGAVGRVAIIV